MTDSLIDRPEPHEPRIDTLVAAFQQQFGRTPEGIAEAPGRVNLIGEHVDYNDGLVLPFAIDRSVMCAWGDTPKEWFPSPQTRAAMDAAEEQVARESGMVLPIGVLSAFNNVYSIDLDSMIELVIDVEHAVVDRSPQSVQFMPLYHGPVHSDATSRWGDYVEAVFWHLRQVTDALESTDIAMAGDVPQGAGLSSSASLEVSLAGAVRAAFELSLSDSELALLCQRAENEYVGVQCGIMDQFASAISKRDHALLIDCRTLAYKHVPLRLEEHGLAIVIANSAVRRELITSAYNDRRRECEEAVVRLRDLLGRPSLHSLRDVRMAEMDDIEIHSDDIPLRRARHVVSEIDRVAEAVDALEHNDFIRLGELMVQSHLSLKTDYAVSSGQLDLLVGLATAQEYVLGARLTGAGFGGCTVNLIRADRVEDFARDVVAPYRERTGLPAVMYVTPACDGLKTWRL